MATTTKGYAPSMKRIYQLHKALTKMANTQGTKYGEYGIIVAPRDEISKYEPTLDITKTYISTIISFLEEIDVIYRINADDKGPARLDVRQFIKLESLTKIVDVVTEKNELARQAYHNQKEEGRSHMKQAVVVKAEEKAVVTPAPTPVKEEKVEQTELVVAEVKPDELTEAPTVADLKETIDDGVGHLTETTKELVSYLTSLSSQIQYADPGLVAGLRQEKQTADNKARRLEIELKDVKDANERLGSTAKQNITVITELNKRVTQLETNEKKHIAAERAQASNLEKAKSDLTNAQGTITKLQAELKAAQEKAEASMSVEVTDSIKMSADGLRQDINNLCQLAPWQFSKSRHQYQNSMKRQLDSICRTLGIDVK